MRDFILEILFATADATVEELVQSQLYLSASTGSTSDDNGVYAYFDSPEDRERAAASLADIHGVELRTAERERADWLELYQQSLEPLFIGERFIVAPDPSLIAEGGERLKLVIPQEQAFGTGSHETTSLCIELLEAMAVDGRRGLDIGSGSGILALAMLRLGASQVVAFDNDPDAYAALRENRDRNGIARERMPLFIGPLEALRGGTFDVVTMNILPDVVMAMLPQVVRHLSRDARVIVSGILIVRSAEVLEAAKSEGLELVRGVEKGEWWAGELRRA